MFQPVTFKDIFAIWRMQLASYLCVAASLSFVLWLTPSPYKMHAAVAFMFGVATVYIFWFGNVLALRLDRLYTRIGYTSSGQGHHLRIRYWIPLLIEAELVWAFLISHWHRKALPVIPLSDCPLPMTFRLPRSIPFWQEMLSGILFSCMGWWGLFDGASHGGLILQFIGGLIFVWGLCSFARILLGTYKDCGAMIVSDAGVTLINARFMGQKKFYPWGDIKEIVHQTDPKPTSGLGLGLRVQEKSGVSVASINYTYGYNPQEFANYLWGLRQKYVAE